MKCGLKIVLVSRPGHAVSLFWRVFFQGPRGLPCLQLPQACQNQHYRTKTFFFSWIQTQRLTSAEDDMWFENGPRESARPCSFPVLKVFFFKVPEVFHVYNSHKPAKTSNIVPKPYSFLADADATFDIGGGWHAVRKWTSWVGQTMLLPRSEGFFFKAPEVFLVYNFHKPAKTSIIVPKPYTFLVDSDATFDTGGRWHVDWKSSSWVGRAMQFPCFERFFSRSQRSSMSTTSTSLPKPALSYQNLIVF